MTKKIVDKPYTMDIHGNIKYPEPPKAQEVEAQDEPYTDVSIDTLLRRGLSTIDLIMKNCKSQVKSGEAAPREAVQNLKDCMAMLKDLKQQESDVLDGMTDDQVEEYLKVKKK
jgi:hypothetical protein